MWHAVMIRSRIKRKAETVLWASKQEVISRQVNRISGFDHQWCPWKSTSAICRPIIILSLGADSTVASLGDTYIIQEN